MDGHPIFSVVIAGVASIHKFLVRIGLFLHFIGGTPENKCFNSNNQNQLYVVFVTRPQLHLCTNAARETRCTLTDLREIIRNHRA